jgi:hypothetical protein
LGKILAEYANKDSILNYDLTHNGCGKPIIIIEDRHISIYDGMFGVFGEMYTDAKFISKITGCHVMAVSNVCNDSGGVFIVYDDNIIMEATNDFGEWVSNIDAARFIETMHLSCTANQLNDLFKKNFDEHYDLSDFILELEKALNYPHAVLSSNDKRFSALLTYLELFKIGHFVDVYRKTRPFVLPIHYNRT